MKERELDMIIESMLNINKINISCWKLFSAETIVYEFINTLESAF